MPDVRSISFADGIEIVTLVRTVHITGATMIATPGTVKQVEAAATAYLQGQFQSRYALADYPVDHRLRQPTPSLYVWEEIDGTDVIVTTMWIAVHVFSKSPLKYTLCCQNKELGPIAGEWWL